MTAEQRVALARLVEDDYLLDALEAVCQEEFSAYFGRLIASTQVPDTNLNVLVQEGTAARVYSEFVAMLRRRVIHDAHEAQFVRPSP